MKVKELLSRLAIEDPEMRILVDGYELGFDELDHVRYVDIVPNLTKKDWEGEFEQVSEDHEGAEIALLLPRKS